MKSTLIATSLLASMALASPLNRRVMETDVDWVIVTVTVTGDKEAATQPPAWGGGGENWGPWAGSQSASSLSSTPSTPAAPPPQQPVATTPAAPPPPAVTTTPVGAWSSPTPSSVGSGSGSSYSQAILDQHNSHRANASTPALVWDDNMANIAQTIGESCVYAHNTDAGGGGYGQNIGAGSDPGSVPALVTNEMYNDEIGWYPLPYGAEPDMTNFEHWGHYSQIMWASTTSVGCATVDCSSKGLANVGSGVSAWFTVCNYSPAGNMAGSYGANVKAPGTMAPVTVGDD